MLTKLTIIDFFKGLLPLLELEWDILLRKNLSSIVFVKALCCTFCTMFYTDWEENKGGNPQVLPTFKYKVNKGGLSGLRGGLTLKWGHIRKCPYLRGNKIRFLKTLFYPQVYYVTKLFYSWDPFVGTEQTELNKDKINMNVCCIL